MFESDEIDALVEKARTGMWAPLARAVTVVENSPPWEVSVPRASQPCHIVGITGPPGAGKSTLTGRLIESFVDAGERVAVLAIDPSSPLSGGAVLGDRIRMETHLAGRPGVFVRSLASRGSHGAVAGATRNIARLLELSGLFDVVLIETVGAGQTEVAIVEVADTVLLVTVPGLGDAVQTIKAGLMEIADSFVVNMADRPGAAETARHLRLAAGRADAVYKTVAVDGTGVDELRTGLQKRWQALLDGGRLAAERAEKWGSDAALVAEAWVGDCAASIALDPHEPMQNAVERILKEAVRRWTS
ncbi:methylmalonyl Co-A mutase-associated GTPase MeaB [Amycolatopsis panacis]|uniref:Methylmalonyl Co-A mutase-associated GTPase MeaB n=1 Tax=Amycolatopsis panacis TaxID=2340917 RepID=A0A419HVI6_9PSEU|nr:methylmalonyl Co-A mutase-associated GTPase MeaB [Amycolatopsis panacis]RJQ80881.1 methylmalonyl Co-A mutase-associated GTPase MeaB [Amycolatopsis panacis]